MKVRIRKWGNSASVRIPASVMASGAFQLDQAVEITERDGSIVIEPIAAAYDLDALVAEMDSETFPDDVAFGRPVGGEVW